MKTTVFLFHMDPDRTEKVSQALRGTGTVVRTVDTEGEKIPLALLTGQPLSSILRAGDSRGKRTIQLPAAIPLAEEMIVITGADDSGLDRILSHLRSAGMQSVLKAVLTDNNIAWNARQLYHEMCEERSKIRHST